MTYQYKDLLLIIEFSYTSAVKTVVFRCIPNFTKVFSHNPSLGFTSPLLMCSVCVCGLGRGSHFAGIWAETPEALRLLLAVLVRLVEKHPQSFIHQKPGWETQQPLGERRHKSGGRSQTPQRPTLSGRGQRRQGGARGKSQQGGEQRLETVKKKSDGFQVQGEQRRGSEAT